MSNSKPSIFVTRRLPQDVEARLIRDYVAELNESDKPFTAEQILAGAEGHDGIICTPTDKIDANLIAQLPHTIKIVATFSVGFDHVDLEAAKDRGLVVTNTPEVLTDATADLTMLLLLGAARRAYEGQKMLYAGEWDGWRPTVTLRRYSCAHRRASSTIWGPAWWPRRPPPKAGASSSSGRIFPPTISPTPPGG